MTRVLVVEDDRSLVRALANNLKVRGYKVDVATDGVTAVKRAADKRPDLVIVDLGLPELDGLEVIRSIRGWTEIPIIVLSARGSEDDKIEALDAGADDYVAKPFGMGELLARVRAALRRATPSDSMATVETPHFTIDLASKKVRVGGEEVHLTPTEWGMLEMLVRNPGSLVSQTMILREVWGPTYEDETHYLRSYIAQIRRKLEPEPSRPRYFITEPGMGYRFEPASGSNGLV
ncbi:MAG TPA: response regulator transcription factor [Acidimicrobiia bacterium]|nr:response regulator transcription factor [Acidimicrobiia bacterium]